mmetsp:Transcript_45970/g.60921  ORF Transcript_45970/g.60921 Transcript_45970/m.60921 type:complete len:268 (-) Transcript_45970:310-1113(-)
MAPWRARWTKVLIDPLYMGVLTGINVAYSLLLLLIDRATVYWKETFFVPIAVIAIFISLVFTVDMIVHFVVLGPHSCWKEKKYIYYELLLQVSAIALIIYAMTSNLDYTVDGYFTEISLLFLLRCARIFFFTSEVESIRLIMETSRMISKPILGKFLFIYLVFYVYAQLGALLFGGELTYSEYYKHGAPPFYYTLNFNDFGASLVVLFHQMVVNNWFLTVDQYTAIMGEGSVIWVRIYFVSFWVTIVLIQLNILIAIVLEIFGSVAD